MKPRTGKRSNSNSSTTPTCFMSPSPEPSTQSHIFLPEDSGGELSKVSQLVRPTRDSMDKLIRSGEEWQAGEPSVAPTDSSSGTTTGTYSAPIPFTAGRNGSASPPRHAISPVCGRKKNPAENGSASSSTACFPRSPHRPKSNGPYKHRCLTDSFPEEEAEEVERQVRAGMELPGMEAYYEEGWNCACRTGDSLTRW